MLKALVLCIATLGFAQISLAKPLDKSASALADGPKKGGTGGAPAGKKIPPPSGPKKGTAGAPGVGK